MPLGGRGPKLIWAKSIKHLSGWLFFFVHKKTKKKRKNRLNLNLYHLLESTSWKDNWWEAARSSQQLDSLLGYFRRLDADGRQFAWRRWFPITAKRRHLHPAHGCRVYSNSRHVSWRAAPACTALCCLNYPEWSHYLWQREAQLCIQQVGGTTITAAAAAGAPDDRPGGGRKPRHHQGEGGSISVKWPDLDTALKSGLQYKGHLVLESIGRWHDVADPPSKGIIWHQSLAAPKFVSTH